MPPLPAPPANHGLQITLWVTNKREERQQILVGTASDRKPTLGIEDSAFNRQPKWLKKQNTGFATTGGASDGERASASSEDRSCSRTPEKFSSEFCPLSNPPIHKWKNISTASVNVRDHVLWHFVHIFYLVIMPFSDFRQHTECLLSFWVYCFGFFIRYLQTASNKRTNGNSISW